jgi:hypothetical protein
LKKYWNYFALVAITLFGIYFLLFSSQESPADKVVQINTEAGEELDFLPSAESLSEEAGPTNDSQATNQSSINYYSFDSVMSAYNEKSVALLKAFKKAEVLSQVTEESAEANYVLHKIVSQCRSLPQTRIASQADLDFRISNSKTQSSQKLDHVIRKLMTRVALCNHLVDYLGLARLRGELDNGEFPGKYRRLAMEAGHPIAQMLRDDIWNEDSHEVKIRRNSTLTNAYDYIKEHPGERAEFFGNLRSQYVRNGDGSADDIMKRMTDETATVLTVMRSLAEWQLAGLSLDEAQALLAARAESHLLPSEVEQFNTQMVQLREKIERGDWSFLDADDKSPKAER